MKSRSLVGTVAELHALPMPTEGDQAELWVMEPSAAAVAMGSSQKPEFFDQERFAQDQIQLAPRRSGGGAVFIDPSSTVWIDVLAPRSSALWSQDLGENFLIVGRIWQQALAVLGVSTELCIEAPKRTEAASLACWAGLGWGELTVGPDHAKVVGLSQRRTRWGCRVQAMAVLDGSSPRVADYLLPPGRATVQNAIPTAATAVSPPVLQAAVLAAFGAV